MNASSQHFETPAEYRVSNPQTTIEQDPQSVATQSNKLTAPSMAEVFRNLDSAGAADFIVERDLSLPSERDAL